MLILLWAKLEKLQNSYRRSEYIYQAVLECFKGGIHVVITILVILQHNFCRANDNEKVVVLNVFLKTMTSFYEQFYEM